MLKIVICDDNHVHLREIAARTEEAVKEEPHKMFLFSGAQECLAFFEQGIPGSILLLDISLGDHQDDGITLAKKILQASPETQIIFITAHLQYAVDIDEVDHIYFLLKPLNEIKLRSALQKAREKLHTSLIVFHRKGETKMVRQNEILYIERIKRASYVHCISETFVIPEKLEEILLRLDRRLFFRCHNSYLAAWPQVAAFQTGCLKMRDGAKIPVSRAYCQVVKDHYTDYIGGLL